MAPPSSAKPAQARSAADDRVTPIHPPAAKYTRGVHHSSARLILVVAIAAALSVRIDRATAERQATYTAQRAGDVVRLRDAGHDINLTVMPSVGNMAVDMTVK